jgi:5'-nucleotidase
MKTVLLINDDGINSKGLIIIKKKIEKLGRIVVIAPKNEISGVGKAITTTKPVKIEEVRLSDGSEAYAINGTPADAYLIAVNKILKKHPDLLVAGINLGPNLGIDDFLTSGTIGAALESSIHGVPAIAISYCKKEIDDQNANKAKITMEELESAANVAQRIIGYVLNYGMPKDVEILSINVPEKMDYDKMRVTTLSYAGYGDLHTEERDGYRIAHWMLADYSDRNPDTDVYAVKEKNCISITPIKIGFTNNKKSVEEMLKNLKITF